MTQMRGSVSDRIIQEISRTAATERVELPSLYAVIDPDALEAVVETMSDGEVSFSYAGYEVTVTAEKAIRLEPRPTSETATGIALSND
ncbi:HalOD1 output domain-containing protein [Haloarcula nitratireducens]|uniref:Halobacterial output domain-containing protein n=1 Tax=Haloarcula nitratireducens TaxID=2487749 RepID=A0AAW4PIP0_9EURY|nr:HalOD1 output domain-containing protein [Halomicroarcula nitratireducens]MBX0297849.1 hypothetical protein [Halomicroarcula nitratireducens]